MTEKDAGPPMGRFEVVSLDLLSVMLEHPLKSIAVIAGGAIVGHLAVQTVDLLEKLIAKALGIG
jgi:hypothetical protein